MNMKKYVKAETKLGFTVVMDCGDHIHVEPPTGTPYECYGYTLEEAIKIHKKANDGYPIKIFNNAELKKYVVATHSYSGWEISLNQYEAVNDLDLYQEIVKDYYLPDNSLIPETLSDLQEIFEKHEQTIEILEIK